MHKILVVEDNPANMEFAVTVLESAGHRILQAAAAAAGTRLAHEALPDLIFMDIQLPGGSRRMQPRATFPFMR